MGNNEINECKQLGDIRLCDSPQKEETEFWKNRTEDANEINAKVNIPEEYELQIINEREKQIIADHERSHSKIREENKTNGNFIKRSTSNIFIV